ncbi:hypothetical protein GLOTRDRAFT_97147 [Gloeophyllum trabeum ATCC 11539]|uniref:Deoxyribose-phosphate aldolase n=1 Tax=Gloeophyllum trabeum (strain ATCC 11539 / FP-39264 / Madison 617) TaxID=670483 RepID=S7PQZ7_GLOTA|nr:uncharacterized protein GLOTRDRAFT_97147 [Gloeophyllum trabeum ATCC 11539]EPQ50251.1 hypothetical protein GLOTRDRAFT_97147 [Gloeophyllum trabeum ATCC 11539]
MAPQKPLRSVADIAALIDHSLLHPTLTDAEIQRGLELARDYKVATAFIKPYSIPQAINILSGSGLAHLFALHEDTSNASPTSFRVPQPQHYHLRGAGIARTVIDIPGQFNSSAPFLSNAETAVKQREYCPAASSSGVCPQDGIAMDHRDGRLGRHGYSNNVPTRLREKSAALVDRAPCHRLHLRGL